MLMQGKLLLFSFCTPVVCLFMQVSRSGAADLWAFAMLPDKLPDRVKFANPSWLPRKYLHSCHFQAHASQNAAHCDFKSLICYSHRRKLPLSRSAEQALTCFLFEAYTIIDPWWGQINILKWAHVMYKLHSLKDGLRAVKSLYLLTIVRESLW